MSKLPHHSLIVWQRADDPYIELHLLTIRDFPPFERFELGSQLRRAVYSVAANLVEGTARRYRRDRLRFFSVSESSLFGGRLRCPRRSAPWLHRRRNR